WLPPMSPCYLRHTSPTVLYTLSLHDALPISRMSGFGVSSIVRSCLVLIFVVATSLGRQSATAAALMTMLAPGACCSTASRISSRSEEHTSELQSRVDLVCRLLLEKKKVSLSL